MKLEKPTTTNTYNRPWSVVDDQELKRLRAIEARAKGLTRGCHCDYDYRCGNCDRIIDILDLIDPSRATK